MCAFVEKHVHGTARLPELLPGKCGSASNTDDPCYSRSVWETIFTEQRGKQYKNTLKGYDAIHVHLTEMERM